MSSGVSFGCSMLSVSLLSLPANLTRKQTLAGPRPGAPLVKAAAPTPERRLGPRRGYRPPHRSGFHQINKKTGNRIKYRKVDADTGDEIDSTDIIKGYEVGKGQYIEINPEELEAIAIESKRTIEIDEFANQVYVPIRGNGPGTS
jgi:hypothetical protein